MGAMRKMAVYLGLVEDDNLDYVDEHDDYDDPRPVSRHEPQGYSSVREVPQPTRSSAASRPVSTAPATRGNLATDTAVHADVRHEVRPADPVSVSDLYRITTLHPRSYNDARRIGEEFRDGVPVIMNLSDMDDAEAKRLVDFAAGLIFGCRGSIERITNKVFLLSPQNVDVAAEAHRLAQDGFFNQS
ncbi:MAG: cell division protein SepF [Candidatus Nanopelagicales bacterium]